MAKDSSDTIQKLRDGVAMTARSYSLDRYLSALLAPRAVREDLIALAAFAGEIERIPLAVSDHALGEIRLKWWADWLEDIDGGKLTGNPVADVFGDVVLSRGLSRELIAGVIDVRGQELYSAPFSDRKELREFLRRTEVALVQLALQVLTPGKATDRQLPQSGSQDGALELYGLAYGGVRQVMRAPLHLRRGRWVLAFSGETPDVSRIVDGSDRALADALRHDAIVSIQEDLAAANSTCEKLEKESVLACLPAALVSSYLKAVVRQADWLAREADIQPLTRVWQLWRAQSRRHL